VLSTGECEWFEARLPSISCCISLPALDGRPHHKPISPFVPEQRPNTHVRRNAGVYASAWPGFAASAGRPKAIPVNCMTS
jgi:hypothetical protein